MDKQGPIRLPDIPKIRLLAIGYVVMRDYATAKAIFARIEQYTR